MQMVDNLKQIVEYVCENFEDLDMDDPVEEGYLDDYEEILGATEEEISAFEEKFGIRLPEDALLTDFPDYFTKEDITAKKLENASIYCSQWIEDNKETFVDLLLEKNWASGDRQKVLDFANSLNFVLSDKQTETVMRKVIKDYQSFGLLDKNLKEEEIVEKFWKPMD